MVAAVKFHPRDGEPTPIEHVDGLPRFRWQDEDAVLELITHRRLGACIIEGAPKTEPPPSVAKFAEACHRRRL